MSEDFMKHLINKKKVLDALSEDLTEDCAFIGATYRGAAPVPEEVYPAKYYAFNITPPQIALLLGKLSTELAFVLVEQEEEEEEEEES